MLSLEVNVIADLAAAFPNLSVDNKLPVLLGLIARS
jgi:hypothetical protein